MTVKLAIHEVKDRLSSVLAELAETGEEVEITKHGRVVARLVPPNPTGVKLGIGRCVTHALIWLVHAPDRLGEDGRSALTSTDAEAYASHVSLWEMAIKRSSGKLTQLDRAAPE